jgi:hypothetical protein
MKGELAALTDLAKRLVASDTPGTLSTLFCARGSTYRALGSMMVSLPGMHAGGISEAISMNILHFPARVLVIAGGKEPRTGSDFDLDTVLLCT